FLGTSHPVRGATEENDGPNKNQRGKVEAYTRAPLELRNPRLGCRRGAHHQLGWKVIIGAGSIQSPAHGSSSRVSRSGGGRAFNRGRPSQSGHDSRERTTGRVAATTFPT